jgi:TP901 family phage tail tape measure protein
MNQGFRTSTTAMNGAAGAANKFTAQCQKTTRCTNQAAAGLKRTRLGLSGVGTGAFVAGAALTAGFTRPLIGAISAAGDFQSAMNLVGVLTNVDRTSKAFVGLEEKALELGSTTQFTAVQAAEGMQFLAKTGLEANEVLSAIPSTLNLAAAASIDLGRASDITTNILKGFRLEMEDLPKAVDILAATFSSSNTDIEQLAASFKKAGPVAAEFGQEFKDVAAIIGALGDAGIQAEESGVALRRLFINLQNDAAKSNSILKQFGISIQDDVTGQMRPLIDIFEEIKAAPLTAGQRIKLFGARALAAAGIIENSVEGLDEFANAITNSVGRAAEIGEARLKGFNGATLLFNSALEGAGIAIAQSGLLDFFTLVVQGATTAIRAITALPKPLLFVIGAFLTLGAALGAILLPIGLIAVGMSTLAPLVAGLTFAGVATSIGVFLAAAAPVVAIIAGLVVGFNAIKDIQFELGGTTLTLGAIVEETFSTMGDLLDDAVLGFKLLAQGSGSTTNALAADSKKMTDNLPSFGEFTASAIASFEIFGRVVAAIFVRIGKGIAKFGSNIVDAFNAIPEAIKAAFDGDEATSVGDILASKFKAGFIKEFEGLPDEVAAIVEDATAKANSALSLLGQSDFAQRAAARVGPGAEEPGAGGGRGDGAITPPGGDGAGGGGFQTTASQMETAAASVQKLIAATQPGTAAIFEMVKATNELNNAQQLGIISGEQNVAILRQLREGGAEELLASINPVTAAYRDQSIALQELAIAKDLFNLTDQEAALAGDLIKEQTQERLLQLDEFKNKLSGIDSVRMGLSEGFKDFVKGLGTQFDIVKGGVTQLGGVISNQLTTAIKDGEFSFKEFGSTVIDTIQQIVVQLLIQIALQAVLKALGGGGTGAAANGASITPMADGGPINGSVGQTFLVGEEGPELFVPKTSGDIVPNGKTSGMLNGPPAAPPVVNVQVVNVDDQSGVPDAMSTTEGEKVIMNTIQRNRNQLKEIL